MLVPGQSWVCEWSGTTPGPTQGEEGWIPNTQSTNWEGEVTDPILALAAFSGTNHFFTAGHSSVGKNLAFFFVSAGN